MKLERYICDLLYRHDCVIVPGFGGFIIHAKPATIHPARNSFQPPSREIVFNAELTTNDGLLANFLAMIRGESYEDTLQMINDSVLLWNQQLARQETLNLKGIGDFTLNTDKKPVFSPDTTVNYLEDAYGLTEFVSPAIQRETNRILLAKRFADRKSRTKKPSHAGIIRRIATTSLPIAALVIWGIFNWNTVQSTYTNSAGLFSFFRYSSGINHEKEMPVTPHIINSASIIPIPVMKSLPATEKQAGLKYFIIGGAFLSEENAQNFVKSCQSKGHQATIIDKTRNGLFRVSVDGFATLEEANLQLKEIQQTINGSAWILNK
ncbi:MAG: SPOR domain-containing protein [Lentimicrobiaceae bacterium]|nr:SPOR domain-containing protein [Lentimicrobiaceae bacterium]